MSVSSLFDANFYRATNSDLASLSETQLRNHFETAGIFEGRRFSALVDLNVYRASNPDLARLNNAQLLSHLEQAGIAEGRTFSPFIDLNYYRLANGDLGALNNEQLFTHLRNSGLSEGRRFGAVYDSSVYNYFNADLRAARLTGKQLFDHWQVSGLNEGRKFSQFVDLSLYKGDNPDLANLTNLQAINHLVLAGINEGRHYSQTFSTDFYKTENPDLAGTGMTNAQLLTHFQLAGINEGRMGSANFNARVYTSNNADLASLAPFQALTHFILDGAQRPGLDYAGNTTQQARAVNLPGDGSTINFLDYVGPLDSADVYRFTLGTAGTVKLDLSGLTGDANLQVLNSGGTPIQSSNNPDAAAESITLDLQTGTYFVSVVPGSNTAKTLYNLALSTIPVDTVGNTSATARELLLGSRLNEYIGGNDTNDYYKFSLNATTDIEAVINQLSSNANLELLAGDGTTVLASSLNSGNVADAIARTLDPGDYYLRVFQPANTPGTPYRISLGAPNLGGGVTLWTRQLGSAEDDVSQDVAIDGQGNVYIVGYTYDQLDPNRANGDPAVSARKDAFISKYNDAGVLQWTKQSGLAGEDEYFTVTIDSQGTIYVGGIAPGAQNATRGIVTAFDSTGALLANKSFAYGSHEIVSLATNGAGNLVVGNGTQIAFFNPASVSQPVSAFSVDQYSGFTLDAAGNVYVTGSTSSALDSTLPDLNNDGEPDAIGQTDAWVAKYNAQGVKQWLRQVGTVDFEESAAVTVDAAGNVYIAGTTSGSFDPNRTVPQGSNDLWYAKFDAQGTQQWLKQEFTPENPEDGAFDLEVDGSGKLYVAGLLDYRPLLLKVDSATGNVELTRQLGSATADAATESSTRGLELDTLGNLYLTGDTKEFLGGANVGNRDAWVAKLQA